ncbi:hypothetical protein DPMN_085358 [Dreissena polymorpha]|uniref:Uncharacterized protein n=1 Tax=Dreissena polymorpha TaxID=45954 RepID=A0A9D3YCJ1_DREPO|nr:hypothetical protein DPMN_085358 [Dreissena polymorpha]
MDKNNALTKLNNGLRSLYSCKTHLVVTVHDLRGSMTRTNRFIGDSSKAFNTVLDQRLLLKLDNYGIRVHYATGYHTSSHNLKCAWWLKERSPVTLL